MDNVDMSVENEPRSDELLPEAMYEVLKSGLETLDISEAQYREELQTQLQQVRATERQIEITSKTREGLWQGWMGQLANFDPVYSASYYLDHNYREQGGVSRFDQLEKLHNRGKLLLQLSEALKSGQSLPAWVLSTDSTQLSVDRNQTAAYMTFNSSLGMLYPSGLQLEFEESVDYMGVAAQSPRRLFLFLQDVTTIQSSSGGWDDEVWLNDPEKTQYAHLDETLLDPSWYSPDDSYLRNQRHIVLGDSTVAVDSRYHRSGDIIVGGQAIEQKFNEFNERIAKTARVDTATAGLIRETVQTVL